MVVGQDPLESSQWLLSRGRIAFVSSYYSTVYLVQHFTMQKLYDIEVPAQSAGLFCKFQDFLDENQHTHPVI